MTPFPPTVQQADEQAFLALHQLLQRLCPRDIAQFVSQLGNGTVVILLGLGVLAFERDTARAVRRLLLVGAVLAVVGGTMHLCKNVLPRERPASALPAEFARGEAALEFDEAKRVASFPSGHTATAFALATILCGWAGALVPAWRRRSVRGTLVALAIGVGLARIYTGAHFPLDVLAGAFVGTGSALLVRALLRGVLDPATPRPTS